MSDILRTKRRVNPRIVEQLHEFFSQRPILRGADVMGLTVLVLGRRGQKDLFADAGIQVPTGSDFVATCLFACRALVDFVRPWQDAPASSIFDLRSQAVLDAMHGFENWSRDSYFAWRRWARGEEIGERWVEVLKWQQLIYETVNPRKLDQFPSAAKEALERLEQLSDPDDPETTAAEVQSALIEIHEHLLFHKGDPALFVGTADGQLRLGWRQFRDALEQSRGISRRKIRRQQQFGERQLVEEALAAQDRAHAADTVDARDALDRVQEYLEARLQACREGSNRWHVVRHFSELRSGELTPSALAKSLGRAYAGVWKAYQEESEALLRAFEES